MQSQQIRQMEPETSQVFHRRYFSQAIFKQKLKFQKIEKYNHLLNDKICHQIEDGNMKIPSNQIPLKIAIKEKVQKIQPTEEQLLKSLQEKRKETIEKLRQIQRDQFQIKEKRRIISLQKSIKQEKAKSQLTQTDRRQLAKILKNKKKHQEYIQQLTEQKLKGYHQISIKQKQLQNEQIRKIKQMRRSIIEQNFKSLELQKEEKKKRKRVLKAQQEQIKDKKYLYQVILENHQNKRNQIQKDKQVQMEKIHRRYNFDINQIKQHQRKYEALITKNQQKLDKKLENMKVSLNNQVVSFQDNYFRKLTRKEKLQLKEKQQQKIIKADQFKKRISQFQEYIDNKIRPSIITSKQQKEPQQILRGKILSSMQLRSLGDKYMEKSKEIARSVRQNNQSMGMKTNKILESISPKIQYKNYLRQLKTRSHYSAEHQFSEMVRKGSQFQDYDSANKAFFLAEQLNAKTKKLKDDKLYESAKHKLQLLKVLL